MGRVFQGDGIQFEGFLAGLVSGVEGLANRFDHGIALTLELGVNNVAEGVFGKPVKAGDKAQDDDIAGPAAARGPFGQAPLGKGIGYLSGPNVGRDMLPFPQPGNWKVLVDHGAEIPHFVHMINGVGIIQRNQHVRMAL